MGDADRPVNGCICGCGYLTRFDPPKHGGDAYVCGRCGKTGRTATWQQHRAALPQAPDSTISPHMALLVGAVLILFGLLIAFSR